MDTFEYKPLLQRNHGKPLPFAKPKVTFAATGNLLASPWKFKKYGQCGHQVSELFPNVARHVDDICFLHGAHGTNPAHGGALLKLHTGADNFVRPSMGAWVSYGLGTENANLPAFVTICPTLAHGGVNNWGSAFLPAHYAGTPIGNASIKAKDAKVHHIKNPKWTPGQQRTQLDFLKQLNRDHLGGAPNPVLESRDAGDSRHPRRDQSHAQTLRPRQRGHRRFRTTMFDGATVCRARRAFRASNPQRQQSAMGPTRQPPQRPH
jgi:hypothetical protein